MCLLGVLNQAVSVLTYVAPCLCPCVPVCVCVQTSLVKKSMAAQVVGEGGVPVPVVVTPAPAGYPVVATQPQVRTHTHTHTHTYTHLLVHSMHNLRTCRVQSTPSAHSARRPHSLRCAHTHTHTHTHKTLRHTVLACSPGRHIDGLACEKTDSRVCVLHAHAGDPSPRHPALRRPPTIRRIQPSQQHSSARRPRTRAPSRRPARIFALPPPNHVHTRPVKRHDPRLKRRPPFRPPKRPPFSEHSQRCHGHGPLVPHKRTGRAQRSFHHAYAHTGLWKRV